MEFHRPVVCTTGHDNTPTIPCLDFTLLFANNDRMFALRANMEPIPTHGCTFRLLIQTWKHPHRQRMEEAAEPIVQHTTKLHPAAYRFQARSSCRCVPGSGVGPDGPGFNTQDNGPRVEGRGRIRSQSREAPGRDAPARGMGVRPTGPSPRQPGRRTRLRHGRPCPPGPCGRFQPRPASGRG